MKNNKLKIIILSFCLLFALSGAKAQDSTSHKFTTLQMEMRASFDAQGEWSDTQDTTHYGFNGNYFNINVAGKFGKGFSYCFRQRVIANSGTASLFDNTDFLYLHYQINDKWGVRVGKDALAIGGFEYDAAPIDVYYYATYWGEIYCFQLGTSAIYTDLAKKNKVTFQVANSPYVHFLGTGKEWKQGLFGYSIRWDGDFRHFKTMYSVSMFERQRGDFVSHIILGHQLEFGCWKWYVDYINRVANVRKFFSDFTVVSRMDFAIRNVNLFLKGGYDQNMAEESGVLVARDCMMTPGERYWFYGLGAEYHPKGSRAVRLHACLYDATSLNSGAGARKNVLTGEVGITCTVDFLRYFQKKLNSKQ